MKSIERFMGKIKTLHFIGIGGIGMSGLAEILLKRGFRVQGSDLRGTAVMRRLEREGARCFTGHRETHIDNADVVIFSSAVPRDNPEIRAALKRGIPVIRRAELLAEMMRLEYGIAVAGTHGKTTTTSIIAHLLEKTDFDPTVVVGGNANNIGTNARIGDGRFFVAEADESDKSFLLLSPVIAVVTNIDEDHLDTYENMSNILATFERFLRKVPFFGCAVVCGDDPHIRSLIGSLERPVVTYGFNEGNTIRAVQVRTRSGIREFCLRYGDTDLGRFTLKTPGRHMILNAMAALGVAMELGADIEGLRRALPGYAGVKRRMEYKGVSPEGVSIYDDYGHHPTEIAAALAAVGEQVEGPIAVVFQPHRYTRTEHLFDRFARVLSDIGDLTLLPVYAASEKPIPGVTSGALAQKIAGLTGKTVPVMPDIPAAAAHIRRRLKRGDTLLTLGAGDVFRVGELLLRSGDDQG